MLVLGIDTSTKLGSVGLYHSKEGLIGEISLNIKLNHSDTLMRTVDSLFEFTGYKIENVKKIAVAIGPGSFTGIRVGLGCAKGLSYACNIPIVGVNNLDLMSYLTNKEGLVVSMIDARRERVYYRLYNYSTIDGISVLSECKDGTLEDLKKEIGDKEVTFVGDGCVVYRDRLEELFGDSCNFRGKSVSLSKGALLGEVGLAMDDDELATLEPYYHSKTQAERMKEKS